MMMHEKKHGVLQDLQRKKGVSFTHWGGREGTRTNGSPDSMNLLRHAHLTIVPINELAPTQMLSLPKVGNNRILNTSNSLHFSVYFRKVGKKFSPL